MIKKSYLYEGERYLSAIGDISEYRKCGSIEWTHKRKNSHYISMIR
ncbi:hypothetical protein D1AOALGA4SA_2064 [Olavius algarvensis Delta 1 endosymbiont]|nr:hypothetical protein D1AOALGA4SA_2064 [Olavius algarvensis Delta 1 endosymbiont]